MERTAAAIEEKIGDMYGRQFIQFIDYNCLETDRPGGGHSEAGANSARWDSEVQRTEAENSEIGLGRKAVRRAVMF